MVLALAAVGVVTLVVAGPWITLLKAMSGSALHGYAGAIPAICLWLLWQRRDAYAGFQPAPARGLAAAFGLLAVASIAGGVLARNAGVVTAPVSFLSTQILGWVFAVWAAVMAFLGRDAVRRYPFPYLFLLFSVPLPVPVVDAIEVFLQYGSTWAVENALRLLNVTYTRDAHSFWVPGLRFEIATECSGIRSTLVLLIVSILGAHLLLRSPWRQGVIGAVVLPLGIARNAFRICTLALLTIHVDPRVIHSPLHHKGGPLFFAISLIPLLALFVWFRRAERKAQSGPSATASGAHESPTKTPEPRKDPA